MPIIKNDVYATQISENIFKLTNIAPIPFDINSIFGTFHQTALIRFFQQHQTLGLDMAPFVYGFLVHVAVMMDGADLYNPDGSGFITSMNMFVQLVGEPGTNKSGLLKAFNSSMSVLSHLFPNFFSKPNIEMVNGTEKQTSIDLIVNNDTELSLFQKLSKRENVFICSDELDVMNIRFGVYLAGSMENDCKTIGSRLLCQGYDIIKNLTRTTGSTSFHIDRGSINIFGATTGNMLASVFKQYRSSVMSDGTVSRFIYVCSSAHKATAAVPGEILSVQPNMIHLLIVIRLLAEYKPIFVYGQYKNECDSSTTVLVPDDIEDLLRDMDHPISLVETMETLKPTVIVPVQETDRETDGVLLSARSAMRRVIDYEHNKSLKTDKNGNSVFTPLQRAFQRKSSNKIARMGGLCYIISYAIKICYECVDVVRFGDGLFLKNYIDDQQYKRLFQFRDTAKSIIKRKLAEVPTYGIDKRPLIVINKAAVHAAELLYQYTSSTIDALFDDKAINILSEPKPIHNTNFNDEQLKTDSFFEEQAIMLTMTSPILSKAWLSNPVTGLPYTGIFKNYGKSKTKIVRLTNAIDYLVKTGLIQRGVGQTRHLTAARKETFLKTPPQMIRDDPQKTAALESININIETYEHVYMNSPLPTNTELTEEAVKLILSRDEYIPTVHLFNDTRIDREMEHRASNHVIQHALFQGKKHYQTVPSSQQIVYDDNRIEDIFECDLDLFSSNNNLLPKSYVTLSSYDHSSSSSDNEKSALLDSLINSNSLINLATSIELETLNSRISMPIENEIMDIERELFKNYLPSCGSIDKNVISDTTHENMLTTDVYHSPHEPITTNDDLNETSLNEIKQREVQDNNQPKSIGSLIESETSFANIIIKRKPRNYSYSFEPTSDLILNETQSSKRFVEEDAGTSPKKRLKHHYDESDTLELVTSSPHQSLKLTKPCSSSPKKLNSTITIGNTDADEHNGPEYSATLISINLPQSNNSPSVQSPNLVNVNKDCNHVDTISSIVHMLVENVHNINNSDLCENDTNRLTDTQIRSTDNETLSSNILTNMTSNDDPNNVSLTVHESQINTEKDCCSSISTAENDDRILSQIYHKLILSNSIIMSKTEIILKLKHISASTKLREQAIKNLVNDKLLIFGDWFSSNNIKRVVHFTGYLKGFPENDANGQMSFARTLAKYLIDFTDYEQSFKKDGVFPRILEASDIRHKKWLYSEALMNKIISNEFLQERLLIDPSAVIYSSNVQSEHDKRIRVARQRYSPSD